MSSGWKCCKPRVLTFDEFLSIPPCTTGKHSNIDDTPKEPPPPTIEEPTPAPAPRPIAVNDKSLKTQSSQPPQKFSSSGSPLPPEDSGSDDPSVSVPSNTTCKRRGCNASSTAIPSNSRDDEECVYHPGQALFHEGSKGWTCCKRRVLEFDEFMKIQGCKKKRKHLFVGKKKGSDEEEKLLDVR